MIDLELRASREGDPERGTPGAGADVCDERVAHPRRRRSSVSCALRARGIPNATRHARARVFAMNGAPARRR
jgi:hypothetical protein